MLDTLAESFVKDFVTTRDLIFAALLLTIAVDYWALSGKNKNYHD